MKKLILLSLLTVISLSVFAQGGNCPAGQYSVKAADGRNFICVDTMVFTSPLTLNENDVSIDTTTLVATKYDISQVGADGNGIYDGSGLIPTNVLSTLTDEWTIKDGQTNFIGVGLLASDTIATFKNSSNFNSLRLLGNKHALFGEAVETNAQIAIKFDESVDNAITINDGTGITHRVGSSGTGQGNFSVYNSGSLKIQLLTSGLSHFNTGFQTVFGKATSTNGYPVEISGQGMATTQILGLYGSAGLRSFVFAGNPSGNGRDMVGYQTNGTTQFMRLRSGDFNFIDQDLMIGLITDLGSALGVQGPGLTAGTSSVIVENSAGTDALEIKDDLSSTFGGIVTVNAGTGTFYPLTLYKPIATVAQSVYLDFNLNNSIGAQQQYGAIGGYIEDNTSTSEDGGLYFAAVSAGVFNNRATMSGAGNWGFGTSPTTKKLEVAGEVNIVSTSTSPLNITGSGVVDLDINSSNGQASQIDYQTSGVSKWKVGTGGSFGTSYYVFNSVGGGHTFVINNATNHTSIGDSFNAASDNGAWLNISPGTTSEAQINLPSSTAPTTPNDGDIWFDGTDLKIRVSGVTYTLTKT